MKTHWSLLIAAFLAIHSPAFALENLSQYQSADALWQHISELEKGIGNPQTRQEAIKNIIAATAEFQSRFSTDPRRWTAKYVNIVLSQQELANKVEGLKEIAAAPDAPKEAKFGARLSIVQIDCLGLNKWTPAADQEIQAFIHDFPEAPVDAHLQQTRLELLQKANPAKADDLLNCCLVDN